jgi:hypothetical protein
MIFTAVMVPLTDFLTGVLSALILYGLLYRFFDKPVAPPAEQEKALEPVAAGAERNGDGRPAAEVEPARN